MAGVSMSAVEVRDRSGADGPAAGLRVVVRLIVVSDQRLLMVRELVGTDDADRSGTWVLPWAELAQGEGLADGIRRAARCAGVRARPSRYAHTQVDRSDGTLSMFVKTAVEGVPTVADRTRFEAVGWHRRDDLPLSVPSALRAGLVGWESREPYSEYPPTVGTQPGAHWAAGR